jgi:hypothetical protein
MKIQILQIDIVFFGVHPYFPAQQSNEFHFQLVEFLEVDSSYVGYEVVPEENVVEELRSY